MDHPSTPATGDTHSAMIEWEDRAALHRLDDGQGLFEDAKALRRGSFAELISQMMAMPAEERSKYVIQKTGDRKFHPQEIADLASHPDFPGK